MIALQIKTNDDLLKLNHVYGTSYTTDDIPMLLTVHAQDVITPIDPARADFLRTIGYLIVAPT